jgi:tellurite resistance protein
MAPQAFRRDRRGWYVIHDPADRLDYCIDAESWLDDARIASATVTSAPAGLVEQAEHDGARVYLWLSAALLGAVYSVTVTITSTLGQCIERSFRVKVAEL